MAESQTVFHFGVFTLKEENFALISPRAQKVLAVFGSTIITFSMMKSNKPRYTNSPSDRTEPDFHALKAQNRPDFSHWVRTKREVAEVINKKQDGK